MLRESDGVRLDVAMIRQALKAVNAGAWSELLKSDKVNAWTRVNLQEFS